MNKHRILIAIVFALVATVLIMTQASARPTKIPVEAIECTVEIIEPGREWIDEENVLHLRRQVVKKETVSDYALFNGTDIVEININLNLTEGSGNGFGSAEFQPDGVNGKLVGVWTGKFTDGQIAGQTITHGTGDLRPMRGESYFEPITDPTEIPCEGWEPMRFVGVLTDPLGRDLE